MRNGGDDNNGIVSIHSFDSGELTNALMTAIDADKNQQLTMAEFASLDPDGDRIFSTADVLNILKEDQLDKFQNITSSSLTFQKTLKNLQSTPFYQTIFDDKLETIEHINTKRAVQAGIFRWYRVLSIDTYNSLETKLEELKKEKSKWIEARVDKGRNPLDNLHYSVGLENLEKKIANIELTLQLKEEGRLAFKEFVVHFANMVDEFNTTCCVSRKTQMALLRLAVDYSTDMFDYLKHFFEACEKQPQDVDRMSSQIIFINRYFKFAGSGAPKVSLQVENKPYLLDWTPPRYPSFSK
ncbi:hypothetical protein KKA47_04450 [bacterium]|nr:hypothetical protein [bacterium]